MARVIFITFLLSVFGGIFPTSLAQSYLDEWDNPDIVAVIPDHFPEISVLLNGSDDQLRLVDKDAFELEENGEGVALTSVHEGMLNHALNVALVFDHSGEMTLDELEFAREAALSFINTLRVGADSVMLVTFSSGVDNHTDLTDLSYNKQVLDIILSGIEPGGQRTTYDAVQQSLEALGHHEGRKITLLISSGKDSGSSTPLSTVSGSSQLMRIPIYAIQPHPGKSNDLEKLAEDSGGKMIYADSYEDLQEKLVILGEELHQVLQIRYRSPDVSQQIKRSLTVNWKHNSGPYSMRATYRRPAGNMPSAEIENHIQVEDLSPVETRSPLLRIAGMVLAIIVSLGLVIAFIRWRSGVGDRGQIVPAITFIDTEVKKGKIYVKFNVPIRNKPARITLITQQGRPVKDFVFSGKKRQAKLDVSDVSDGIYLCTLTNAGMISEQTELVLST